MRANYWLLFDKVKYFKIYKRTFTELNLLFLNQNYTNEIKLVEE